MNVAVWVGRSKWLLVLALGLLVTGCATSRVNWASRVGLYTYDQAVVDYGPPDKVAKLTDGSTVAEWLTDRGYSYVHTPYPYGYYYTYAWPPVYPYYYQTFNAPDYYLRLVFDPEDKLKSWRRFAK